MTNGYVIEGPQGLVVIDAPEGICGWMERKFPGRKVTHLLLTHQHFDHVEDAAAIQRRYDAQVVAGEAYAKKWTLEDMAKSFGMDLVIEPYMVGEQIKDGAGNWGGLSWTVKPLPGHSPDHVVFLLEDDGLGFVGDTVMKDSVGRTDFEGGSFDVLLNGIRQHLLERDAEMRLYPGHGPETTNVREAERNPFLR